MVHQFSEPLWQALQRAAAGQTAEAETIVRRAAMAAKAKYGSGSHPLTCAYGDMARLHHDIISVFTTVPLMNSAMPTKASDRPTLRRDPTDC